VNNVSEVVLEIANLASILPLKSQNMLLEMLRRVTEYDDDTETEEDLAAYELALADVKNGDCASRSDILGRYAVLK
jgi:hypothetical protein